MPSPASRFAVVIAFVLATASGVAFGAPNFYNNLLRRGVAEFNAGRNAGAVTLLRTAAFGLLDVVDQFETAQAYISVASQRLGREEDARHATRRILAAERVQRRFAVLSLPADLRQEFDAVAKRYLTVAEQAALKDPEAAVPARPPSQTTVRRRSTEPVQTAAPKSSTTASPPPAREETSAPLPAEKVAEVPQAATLPATPPAIVPPLPTPDAPATETTVEVQQPAPVIESAAKAPPTVAEPHPEEPSKIVEEVRPEPAVTTPPPTPAPSRTEAPLAPTPERVVDPEETSAPEPVVVPEDKSTPAVVEPAPVPPAAPAEAARPVEPAPIIPAPAIEPAPSPSVKLPDEPKNEQPSTTPETPAAQPEPAERPPAAAVTPASPPPAAMPSADAVREAQREFERKVQEVERAAPEPPVKPVPLRDVTKSLQDATAALERNDIFGARAMLRRILATEGLSRPDILRVAEESYRAGDFPNATAAFARGGVLRGGEEPFGYYLAVSLYETGRYREAKAALRDALPFIDLTADVARYRAKIEGAVH